MKKIRKKIIMISVLCFMLLSASILSGQKAQAAGNYYIRINKATNVVTVYRSNGTPNRAFVCSTGSATPIGTFNTSQKLRWHVLDGPSYGQYCTRIVGGVLFHSVWYYANGDYASQSYVQYNKLGTTASHGCVRLTVADAKWIYENCPLGTSVTVFWGSSANDPLGKPEAIKIPAKYGSRGWDPTDPMAGNPYSGLRPGISVAGAQTTLQYGAEFNPFAGIAAYDSLGNDISGRMTYSGNVNTKKVGSYSVTYNVTDALGRSASNSVTYNVVDTQKAIIKGVKKTVKTAKDELQSEIGDLSDLSTTSKADLVSAINEIKGSVGDSISAGAITVDSSITTEGMAKSYTIKQNNVSVATIDIPKDMVVSSGTVEENPEGQDEGTYLVLTLANANSDKIYINVGKLIDIYIAQASATQVQLAINPTTREISATIVAGSIGTVELADNAITTVKIADGNVTKTKLAVDVQTSLGKADSALQPSSIVSGVENGTIAVNGTDIKVTGLGSAAYTNADAYESAGAVNALKDGQVTINQTNIEALQTKVQALEAVEYTPITEAQINSLFS